MNILKTIFPLLLILVVISSCRKDTLVIDETEIPPIVTVKFEIEVSGEVFDAFGEPISGASVNLGETFALTDDNGYFEITGLANENKAILSIEKNNYFTGYPVFYPEEGVGQHVRVQLMNREVAGSFSTLDDSAIKIISYGNHQINFGNSTYTNDAGNTYSGNVNVFVTHLDPTDENLSQFMPGDLVGINAANEEQYLKSYGMLNVELEDDAGNTVTMDGEAELTMEIPSTLLGNAPVSIPLWYFDTETGNWIEDGSATLQGSQYVGTVTHFTLWNCDAPFDVVTISGSVNTELDPNSFLIKVIRPHGEVGTTSLNEGVRFEGKVPANEVLTLQIIDLCETVVYDEQIGPFSEDQFLGSLDVSASALTTINVSGTAINCNSNPVNNGYAIISNQSGVTYFVSTNNEGYFETDVAWCDDDQVNITTYDNAANKISETIVMDYDLTVDANTIVTCDDAISGIYISGPDVNLFIPAIGGMTPNNSNPDVPLFTMECIHDQGAGNKVLYNLTLLSWTNNPADPQFVISYTISELGEPDPIYTWSTIDANTIYEIYNPESGGLIDAKYDNAEIIEAFGAAQNATTYFNHTFRIVGIID